MCFWVALALFSSLFLSVAVVFYLKYVIWDDFFVFNKAFYSEKFDPWSLFLVPLINVSLGIDKR